MKYLQIYILTFLNITIANSTHKITSIKNYTNQSDTVGVFKRYKTPLSISKNNGFYEKLELGKNGKFNYLIKIGLIKKIFNGTWKIMNHGLELQDDDTTKIIKIKESFNRSIPLNTKDFLITTISGEAIGYNLIIKPCLGKHIEINDSKTNLDLKINSIKFFQISSVIPFDKYSPLKKSNYFEILINSNKIYLKNSWRIDGIKLYPLVNNNNIYYLEEF